MTRAINNNDLIFGMLPSALAGLGAARPNLARKMSQGALRNPIDLADGGTGLATITPKAFAAGTAGLTQAINYALAPALFQWSGGTPALNPSTIGWCAPVATQRSGGNSGVATRNALAQRFSWMTDATSMDLVTYFTSYKVLVNGQYAGKTVRTDGITSGGYNRLNIALTDTSRQLRRIDIELSTGIVVGGSPDGSRPTIYVGPNDTLSPIPTADRLTLGVVGDSFTTSTGASWQFTGWAPMLGYLLGGNDADVRQIAIGGTSYDWDASNTGTQQYTFAQHIQDLSQASFDLVIFAGGINTGYALSAGGTLAQTQAAALATFQAARALQPTAPFVVLGSWCGTSGPSTQNLQVEAAIQAGFAQFADANSVFVPVCSDPAGAWINATNGPVSGSPDGTHPGDVGHLYLARRANAAIRTALRTTLGIA